jgi:DNA-binding Xre family transcriptional regulator
VRRLSIKRLKISEVAAQNLGWTMRQVADALEVDHQSVMYWNQGRSRPRLETLLALCKLLECQLDELVE